VHLCFPGHVGRDDGGAVRVKGARESLELVLVPAREDDVRPFGREAAGDSLPDIAAGPGDDDGLAGKTLFHVENAP
jgi:hypothetical protein